MDNREQRVISAITEANVGPAAKLEAARLVEAWMEKADSWQDTHWKTLAVEALFYVELEPKTFVVGMVDRIATDTVLSSGGNGNDIYFCEWKSKGAPKVTKAGEIYKGQTESDWLMDIGFGPQLATYALAAREGCFLIPADPNIQYHGGGFSVYSEQHPCILVRAAVKSTPVMIWPVKPLAGIFEFDTATIDAVRNAYLVMAHAIRAARKQGKVPWQIPGYQCKQYNRVCDYYEPYCKPHKHFPIEPVGWAHPDAGNPDPGYNVCKLLGLDVADPELVVLSQSAYQSYGRCLEKGRIDYGGFVLGEASHELEIGSAFHSGLEQFYKNMV